MQWVFDMPYAQAINEARLEHLASLGLPFEGRSVLEVGAGVGLLTGFFEERRCEILSTEGRPENVAENLRRHPWRAVELVDLLRENSHGRFGRFEVVFCYGTLYHLGDPGLCLRDLASVCDSLFLLETCVNPADNGRVNPVAENKLSGDQSLEGFGCRPARDWVWAKLKAQYAFVYATKTQPDHHDYPLKWPAVPAATGLTRAVFVASRTTLHLPTLLPDLPDRQKKLK